MLFVTRLRHDRIARFSLVLVLAAGCSSSTPASSGSGAPQSPTSPSPVVGTPIRVLMLTATTGFRHESIAPARQALSSMAALTGAFVVTATDNVGDVTPDRLSSTDVLMFAMTTGELPFSAAQKSAIIAFVNNGGGFIGTHSAADTLYEWPEYGQLVGAYFKEHPWTQEATVTVEDGAHPTTSGLGSSFRLRDEYYTFRTNPRSSVHVLLSLNAASVGAAGDYPLAWTQTIGRGSSYYNALGHFPETWTDARFQSQITSAIRWASAR